MPVPTPTATVFTRKACLYVPVESSSTVDPRAEREGSARVAPKPSAKTKARTAAKPIQRGAYERIGR